MKSSSSSDCRQNLIILFCSVISLWFGIRELLDAEWLTGILSAVFGTCMLCLCFFKTWIEFRLKQYEKKRLAEQQKLKTEQRQTKPFSKDEFFRDAFSMLEDIEKKYTATPEELARMPKRPPVDWDNGECPYPRDKSKPLGSKENPVVVGIPKDSTHLVYDNSRKIWILTDGLGNGWLR